MLEQVQKVHHGHWNSVNPRWLVSLERNSSEHELSALFMSLAMLMWHYVAYSERYTLDMEPYYKSWEPVSIKVFSSMRSPSVRQTKHICVFRLKSFLRDSKHLKLVTLCSRRAVACFRITFNRQKTGNYVGMPDDMKSVESLEFCQCLQSRMVLDSLSLHVTLKCYG